MFIAQEDESEEVVPVRKQQTNEMSCNTSSESESSCKFSYIQIYYIFKFSYKLNLGGGELFKSWKMCVHPVNKVLMVKCNRPIKTFSFLFICNQLVVQVYIVCIRMLVSLIVYTHYLATYTVNATGTKRVQGYAYCFNSKCTLVPFSYL